MIPRGVEIFVALDPIDLRWGFDRLCGVVAERLGRLPSDLNDGKGDWDVPQHISIIGRKP